VKEWVLEVSNGFLLTIHVIGIVGEFVPSDQHVGLYRDLCTTTSQRPASPGATSIAQQHHHRRIEKTEKEKGTHLIREDINSKLSFRDTNLLFSSLPQFPPQHLADCALGDLIDERDATSQLLVICQPLFHKQLDFLLAQLSLLHGHDIGAWPVGRRVVGSGHTYHGRFFDPRVCE